MALTELPVDRPIWDRVFTVAPLVVIGPAEADAGPARPVADDLKKPAAFPRGALRKCVRGQQVSYTNVACPAGSREEAVADAPVNVLPATPVARVAPPQAPGSSAPSSLHQALDLTRDDKLRDRIMERAIEGATR